MFPCARGRKGAAWLTSWQPERTDPQGQLGRANGRIAFSQAVGVECGGAWKGAGAVIRGAFRRKAIF